MSRAARVSNVFTVPSIPATSETKVRPPRALGVLSAVVKDNLYALTGGRRMYTTAWVKECAVYRCSADIALTAWGDEFELAVGGNAASYQVAATRPMIGRSMCAEDVGMVGFQLDPCHPDFPRFRRLPAPGAMRLERRLFRDFDEEFRAAYRGELTNRAASDLFDRVVAIALSQFPRTKPVDGRVLKVRSLLDQNPKQPLTELAAAAGVSYYRLSHLFAENIGISLRTYQQWRKVYNAILLSKHGYSLTKLAHDAGFTDSAHFCRVFQQMHAAPPSYFFCSGSVRIITPESDVENARGDAA